MNKPDNDWWRGAVFYQIYPRSFQDSDGNGVGDLAGITRRLDHVASLAVDGIWVSPFFTSPMKDYGYDISDFRDVDPLFGTLDDFRVLLARAHALGLKVLIDLVVSHSSDRHPWFAESRSSRDNRRADWYVWADPKPDGTPPNNWLSVFGGPAWEWDSRRRQYYMHNFLPSQPDLNYHNPEVQDAVLDIVRFWLDLGVDGFRLDALSHYFHDAALIDNPARNASELTAANVNPSDWQRPVGTRSRPELIGFLERLRQLLDLYPGTTSIGEVCLDTEERSLPHLTKRDRRLHMAYLSNLSTPGIGPGNVVAPLVDTESYIADGWAAWALSNHDVNRVVSRWGLADHAAAVTPTLIAFMTCLRGSSIVYQGDELGLPEAELSFEQLQDPVGITFWPEFKGRDGCRTPMPWSAEAANAGFSPVAPWLPVAASHLALAVDRQDGEPSSVLNRVRRFLAWRQRQPALRLGTIEFLDTTPPLIACLRRWHGRTILAAFNFGDRPVSLPLPAGQLFIGLPAADFIADIQDGELRLAPFAAAFCLG